MFIRNLPADSRTLAQMHGQMASWTITDYLLANLIDLGAGANWQRSGKGKRPKPFPRPKSAQEQRERDAFMQARMARMAAKHAEWEAQRKQGVNGG